MRATFFIATGLVSLFLLACSPGPKSAAGFRLPDGKPDAGKTVFLTLECQACHTLPGIKLPEATFTGPVQVVLGGSVAKVKTYGELVSSIINPSHKIAAGYPKAMVSKDGESLMTNFNDRLTVQQLIDLVAFLQDKYEIKIPEPQIYYAP